MTPSSTPEYTFQKCPHCNFGMETCDTTPAIVLEYFEGHQKGHRDQLGSRYPKEAA